MYCCGAEADADASGVLLCWLTMKVSSSLMIEIVTDVLNWRYVIISYPFSMVKDIILYVKTRQI